eukprot:scaffold245022_cov32-Tisochrysis_lutea.AAC.1
MCGTPRFLRAHKVHQPLIGRAPFLARAAVEQIDRLEHLAAVVALHHLPAWLLALRARQVEESADARHERNKDSAKSAHVKTSCSMRSEAGSGTRAPSAAAASCKTISLYFYLGKVHLE